MTSHLLADSPITEVDLRRSANRYYPSIQGLRGFSALSVLCVHIYRMAQHGGIFPPVPTNVDLALACLGHGAALFFIISGFVIPASLARHGDLNRFFIDRLLRIMPVFVAIHFLAFIVGPLIGYKWLRDVSASHYIELFLTNLTFTALPLGFPLIQQNSWTLTYEWVFYIFVGVVWLAASKQATRQWILPVMAVATISICLAFHYCLFFLVGIGLARFRPTIRIPRTLEAVLVPVCLVTFYYCAQYVGVIAAIPPALVIFCAALQDGSLTSRLLSTRAMQFVGLISYSLYLVHPIVIFPLEMIAIRLVQHGFQVRVVFPVFAMASVVSSFALSVLSFRLLEGHLRQVLADRIKDRNREPKLSAAPT